MTGIQCIYKYIVSSGRSRSREAPEGRISLKDKSWRWPNTHSALTSQSHRTWTQRAEMGADDKVHWHEKTGAVLSQELQEMRPETGLETSCNIHSRDPPRREATYNTGSRSTEGQGHRQVHLQYTWSRQGLKAWEWGFWATGRRCHWGPR